MTAALRQYAMGAAVVGALSLAGCGSNTTPATPAGDTSAAASQGNTPQGSVAPSDGGANSAGNIPTAPVGNLTGSVSGLNGAVTAFLVRETATATIVEMAADTLFAFDSADLSPQAQDSLNRLKELIAKGGAGNIVVTGHTDDKGTDSYNRDLSRRRAEAVRDWLVAQNAAPTTRFRIEAAGKSQPKVPNANPDGSDNPEGRAQNRRVEVVIPK